MAPRPPSVWTCRRRRLYISYPAAASFAQPIYPYGRPMGVPWAAHRRKPLRDLHARGLLPTADARAFGRARAGVRARVQAGGRAHKRARERAGVQAGVRARVQAGGSLRVRRPRDTYGSTLHTLKVAFCLRSPFHTLLHTAVIACREPPQAHLYHQARARQPWQWHRAHCELTTTLAVAVIA